MTDPILNSEPKSDDSATSSNPITKSKLQKNKLSTYISKKVGRSFSGSQRMDYAVWSLTIPDLIDKTKKLLTNISEDSKISASV